VDGGTCGTETKLQGERRGLEGFGVVCEGRFGKSSCPGERVGARTRRGALQARERGRTRKVKGKKKDKNKVHPTDYLVERGVGGG